MKNIVNKLKNIFVKKDAKVSTKELYEKMDSLLKEAENDIGGNFFPKENNLPTETVHYNTLNLEVGADFVSIKQSYEKLKKEYSPEKYNTDDDNYNKILEISTKLDIAYSYFKKKFNIED